MSSVISPTVTATFLALLLFFHYSNKDENRSEPIAPPIVNNLDYIIHADVDYKNVNIDLLYTLRDGIMHHLQTIESIDERTLLIINKWVEIEIELSNRTIQ